MFIWLAGYQLEGELKGGSENVIRAKLSIGIPQQRNRIAKADDNSKMRL
jgi:hypothetical protein